MTSYIHAHKDQFGVEPICQVLEVAPSTYYAATSRPAPARRLRDEELKVEIERVHKDNFGVYGIEKVWRQKRAVLEQGVAVAVNLRRHGDLIAWARERGLFVRVYRATPWGNPFVIGRDGDRATVIARYRDDHLLARPDLLARLDELRGKALGCWCAPAPCHADVLIGEVERRVRSRSRGATLIDEPLG